MTDPLRDVVAVMDRLYSPGGCPWDAEQTHESLVRYLLEESHELAEAIETGDRAGMREELGDVLLQVLFHARIAADDAGAPFTIDDVAADLDEKLRRRHPHVFAGEQVEDLHARWDAIKKTEKQRTSILDGVPLAQGALARTQKVLSRAQRAGIQVEPPSTPHDAEQAYGAELLDVVRRAQADGVDAEGALRAAVRGVEERVRAAE